MCVNFRLDLMRQLSPAPKNFMNIFSQREPDFWKRSETWNHVEYELRSKSRLIPDALKKLTFLCKNKFKLVLKTTNLKGQVENATKLLYKQIEYLN